LSITANSTAMSNIREHYRCVGPDRVSGWEKLQAQFGRSAGPVYVPVSLPSSLAPVLAQQRFVLGGLIPFETIKRLLRHF